MSLFAKKASTASDPVKEVLQIYEVKTSEQFLTNKTLASLLVKLEHGALIDKTLFLQTYHALLSSFCETVQMLSLGPMGQSPTHLMSASKRAFIHWSAFREYLIAQMGKRYLATDEGARLLFAVFSAGLLFEIGKIDLDKKIILCTQEGLYRGLWHVMLKTIGDFSAHYRVCHGENEVLSSLLTPQTYILAKKIMPDFAYLWLAEDLHLLNLWFQALVLEEAFFGAYRMDFDIVHWHNQHAWFDVYDLEVLGLYGKTLEEAERFWHWLKEEAEKNATDDEHIVFHDGAMLIDIDKAADIYVSAYAHGLNKKNLIDRFTSLGYAELDSDGSLKYYAYCRVQDMQHGLNQNRLFEQNQSKQMFSREHFSDQDSTRVHHFIKVNKQNTTFHLEKALGASAVSQQIQNTPNWAPEEGQAPSSTEAYGRVSGLLGFLLAAASTSKGY